MIGIFLFCGSAGFGSSFGKKKGFGWWVLCSKSLVESIRFFLFFFGGFAPNHHVHVSIIEWSDGLIGLEL